MLQGAERLGYRLGRRGQQIRAVTPPVTRWDRTRGHRSPGRFFSATGLRGDLVIIDDPIKVAWKRTFVELTDLFD